MVGWLREILLTCESEDVRYDSARFDRIDATALAASVTFTAWRHAPVREIKGVTYHGLAVEGDDGGWEARVVFDV